MQLHVCHMITNSVYDGELPRRYIHVATISIQLCHSNY
mgnify:CR=1 FL=1